MPEWDPEEKKEDVHRETVDRETVDKTTKSPEATKQSAETRQIRPQASTQTMETDVRASEVQ